MAKTNLKEMPVEVRSSGKEPQNDFFAAFLEYAKQHADERTSEVQLNVENVSARELVGSYISAAKSVAEAVEKNSDASKRHTFLTMAVALFALSTAPDKEDA